ncbi:MAG: hypothetical protein LBT75_00700 [Bacilli bacterium]|jgi:hypothetical protein|nr:hypothetical protein [Bacilli bacterium]
MKYKYHIRLLLALFLLIILAVWNFYSDPYYLSTYNSMYEINVLNYRLFTLLFYALVFSSFVPIISFYSYKTNSLFDASLKYFKQNYLKQVLLPFLLIELVILFANISLIDIRVMVIHLLVLLIFITTMFIVTIILARMFKEYTIFIIHFVIIFIGFVLSLSIISIDLNYLFGSMFDQDFSIIIFSLCYFILAFLLIKIKLLFDYIKTKKRLLLLIRRVVLFFIYTIGIIIFIKTLLISTHNDLEKKFNNILSIYQLRHNDIFNLSKFIALVCFTVISSTPLIFIIHNLQNGAKNIMMWHTNSVIQIKKYLYLTYLKKIAFVIISELVIILVMLFYLKIPIYSTILDLIIFDLYFYLLVVIILDLFSNNKNIAIIMFLLFLLVKIVILSSI